MQKLAAYLSDFSKSKYFGPTLIVIAALLWSLDGILRAELRSIPPAFLVALEHALGLLFLLPWLVNYWGAIMKASRGTKVALFTTAIISGALGTIFYTAALAQIVFVPFSLVVLMQQLQPLFAVSLSALVLGEKLNGKLVIWGGFALVGAYLLSFPNLVPDLQSSGGIAQALAAVLALCAAISWGSGTVFSKFALKELDFRAATAGRFAITTIAAFALAILLGQTYDITLITTAQWLQLLVIVFSAGMVALAIYYKGLSGTKAQISAFAELTWPLSAFAIDILRGVQFSPSQLIGAVLLLIMITRISRLNR
jgi:drug/metabolite transporter (DMT)-like permease